MQSDIGIDLGTGNTRVFMNNVIELDEPSVITVNKRTEEAVEYGEKAYMSIGRTSDRFVPLCPVERGTISNFEAAKKMIHQYITRVSGNRTLRPRVMVSSPSGLTAVQERSIIEVMESAGARNVYLIESPLAAALEMGVNLDEPRGTVVVDIGKGTTDVAVLSMGRIAECDSVRLAGIDFDEAIVRFVRHEYNISIGLLTAEKIKKQAGCVSKRETDIAVSAGGLNNFTGMPQVFEITSSQVMSAMIDTANQIVDEIKKVFEKTSPELLADGTGTGVILTGGSSLIYGMPELISEQLNMKVIMPENPLTCVARGLGKALEDCAVSRNNDYRFRTLKNLAID